MEMTLIAVQKPEQQQVRTLTTYFAKVQAEVFTPMMQELTALESTLTGDELAAVREFKAGVEQFFAASTARVQSLR